SRERMEVAAERAVKSLANARVLLTHSSSGSVDALFARMAPEGRRVIVTEARPLKEGVRTARALARRGFDVDLIVDAAAASCVPEADAAVLGADSVLRDGGVLNKVGSRSLARAARDAGVAVYVIADTFKFDPRPPESVTIEEMDPAEVLGRAPPGVRVRNPYFDRVEPRDITAIVTERGPLRPSRVARAADALRPWFWA
ncbi:MAG: hypothetical protein KC466_19140, partial [Myxococcales bacterium]|nr:hypothetical protein [Myxococcales bacterium]